MCYLISVANIGVWLSFVERFVRDEEVACTNLVTPTIRPLFIRDSGFSFMYHYRRMQMIAARPYLPFCHQIVYVSCMDIEPEK